MKHILLRLLFCLCLIVIPAGYSFSREQKKKSGGRMSVEYNSKDGGNIAAGFIFSQQELQTSLWWITEFSVPKVKGPVTDLNAWGVIIKPSVFFTLFAGRISFSGTISRLKNPVLAFNAPLQIPALPKMGISCTVPGAAVATVQPISFSAQVPLSMGKLTVSVFPPEYIHGQNNATAVPDNSTKKNQQLFPFFTAFELPLFSDSSTGAGKMALFAGAAPLQAAKQDNQCTKDTASTSRLTPFAAGEFGITKNHFLFFASGSLMKYQEQAITAAISGKTAALMQHLSITAAFSFTNPGFITYSGTHSSDVFHFSINPRLNISFGKNKFTIGFLAGFSRKKERKADNREDIAALFKAAAAIKTRNTSLQLSGELSNCPIFSTFSLLNSQSLCKAGLKVSYIPLYGALKRTWHIMSSVQLYPAGSAQKIIWKAEAESLLYPVKMLMIDCKILLTGKQQNLILRFTPEFELSIPIEKTISIFFINFSIENQFGFIQKEPGFNMTAGYSLRF